MSPLRHGVSMAASVLGRSNAGEVLQQGGSGPALSIDDEVRVRKENTELKQRLAGLEQARSLYGAVGMQHGSGPENATAAAARRPSRSSWPRALQSPSTFSSRRRSRRRSCRSRRMPRLQCCSSDSTAPRERRTAMPPSWR